MTLSTEQLLESLTFAVLYLNDSADIVKVNQAAEGLFGHSRKRLVGKALAKWLPHRHALLDLLARSAQDQRVCHAQRLPWPLPFTTVQRVDAAISPLAQGGWLLELRPLEESQRLQEESERFRQQQDLHHLLRSLAHEIKNPLAGVRGAAQLLARELPEPSLREFTDLIQRESDRLRELVDRLLLPGQSQKRDNVNIHSVLEQVLQTTQLTRSKGIEIQRDYDPSLPDVVGSNDALYQVFLNLMQNAFEAMGESGCLQLKTRAEHSATIGGKRYRRIFRLDVIDNGPGIPVEMQERVFMPLVSGKVNGTGLGLSIAQTLVLQHQGLLECHSEPGNTRFSVWLPWLEI